MLSYKISRIVLAVFSLLFIFGEKLLAAEKTTTKPMCSNIGELSCPKGYTPDCPLMYKPSCVFLGTMQLPSCLVVNNNMNFYDYDTSNISCKSKK